MEGNLSCGQFRARGHVHPTHCSRAPWTAYGGESRELFLGKVWYSGPQPPSSLAAARQGTGAGDGRKVRPDLVAPSASSRVIEASIACRMNRTSDRRRVS